MYCSKCGRRIEDTIRFCPNCGAETQQPTPTQPAAVQITSAGKTGESAEKVSEKFSSCEERTNKWSRKRIITAASVLVIAIGIIVWLTLPLNDDRSNLISLVQNGYLGNYDMVTVKEVLEYSFAGGEWDAGMTLDGQSYIVEYRTDEVVFQFSVQKIGADTFRVSGIGFDGESTDWTAYETKVYLDILYGIYADEHRGCGVVMDKDTSNNTLQGYVR